MFRGSCSDLDDLRITRLALRLVTIGTPLCIAALAVLVTSFFHF